MKRPTPHHQRTLVLILAAVVSAAPAAAQDARQEVPVLPPELVRDVERVIEEAALLSITSVRDALRSLERGGDEGRILSAPEGRTAQGGSRNVERTDRISRRLTLGSSGQLELRNIAGDVTVTGGSGSEVALEVVKRSRARTDADAALGLERVEVTVDHRGDRATVDTVYPRGRAPFDVSTTYTVTAPAGTRLAIRSISGQVSVQGITGDVSVDAISGNVTISKASRVSQARTVSGDIRLTDVAADGTVAAGTLSGNIVVERVKARRLTAENVSGGIRAVEITADAALLKSLSGNVDYSGPLARNGRYEFDSHSGTVRIAIAGGGGFELQARSFSGRIRPEGLSLQSISMDRNQLRATVGDASAVVIAKTFSGDVVITRR